MKKKIVLLLTCINIFFCLSSNVNASCPTSSTPNCLLPSWQDAVDENNMRIRYNWWTKYDVLTRKAVNTWNGLWKVNIVEYFWNQQLQIDIYDKYVPNVAWAWRYKKKYWVPSQIILNKWAFDWDSAMWYFPDNNKQKTITHEFWHALWLAHSNNINWNIMKQWLSGQTWLWNQDKKDYNYLWDN